MSLFLFSLSIKPRIWFICLCFSLNFLLVISVLVLAMLCNSLKLSLFIARKGHSPQSSAFFLGRDLLIPVFVCSHMGKIDLSAIQNLPSVLDCLSFIVRKFWSSPLIAWKYVKTSGQEFFNYREMGRFVHSSNPENSAQ
jgi:hypothetical protein